MVGVFRSIDEMELNYGELHFQIFLGIFNSLLMTELSFQDGIPTPNPIVYELDLLVMYLLLVCYVRCLLALYKKLSN